jgi:CRP-like cAMP-binding protein/di/tricarboxylate transporter
MADLADTLIRIPLFSGLSREDIAKILGKLEEVSFPAGTVIFRQEETADAFYLVRAGAVQVTIESDGHQQMVALLGPSDWFGEMALLSGESRAATVTALADSALWRLGRGAWDDLLEKHPSWLSQFCATLSKRLARLDQQYSDSRAVFSILAANYYENRSAQEQKLLRRAALLESIDPQRPGPLQLRGLADCFEDLRANQPALVQSTANGKIKLQPYFRDFLRDKLSAMDGKAAPVRLHAIIAEDYETAGNWREALQHWVAAECWPDAARLILSRIGLSNADDALVLKTSLDKVPRQYLLSDSKLVHTNANLLIQLGDESGAVRFYQEILARKSVRAEAADTVHRYLSRAERFQEANDLARALRMLREAVNLTDIEAALSEDVRDVRRAGQNISLRDRSGPKSAWSDLSSRLARRLWSRSLAQCLGALLGFAAWAYLWFWPPDLGLDAAATKQLALLALTLIFWVFWVFPDYGVALMFALALILTGLAKPEVVLSGFASTSWFMTLGVLGIGAAITSSGLFYRLSLRLVRVFPLNYHGQVVALGFMGIVVMALIPQQSARTAITSQMLLNLSESLGYKNPSRASTGLFVASFLGLGQLGFLFLTGSTTSLIAWGLLPPDVQARFTWGYWFLAALPPALVVAVCVVAATLLLYKPEQRPQISYKMVEDQLAVLGPMSRPEWITLVMLCFTIIGWLTAGYHKIDGAWIALAALCVLINTGVLGLGMMKKGIDWEMLLSMGVTVAIPTLLMHAKIDQWLVGLISPFVLPWLESPATCFVIIALIAYAAKFVFTSFLTVVTLSVALLPLSNEIGVNPWVMSMIILIASEIWFFPFQIDWHTLSYATTGGKGFSYWLMARINPIYAVAYIVALIVAIPYWRYMGLIH